MPVAGARTGQFLPSGTSRLATLPAHASRWGDGRRRAARIRIGRLIASAMRLTRAKVNVHIAARIAIRGASARRSSARSDRVSAKNLAVRLVIGSPFCDLYQSPFLKRAEQIDKFPAASIGFDVVSLQ